MNDTKVTLTYLVREPVIPSEHPPVIFLLHGLGSNETDLYSLAGQLPEKYLVICVRAPRDLGGNRYAWYRVDFSTGKPVYDWKGVEESVALLVELMSEVREKYAVSDEVYVGGFSQGGIMSYVIGLTRPDLVRGIIVMSGRLLEEVRSAVTSGDELQRLRVFISHGTEDTTLSVGYAREGASYVQSLGINPAYKEYPAGHSIESEMWTDVIRWLDEA